MFLGCYLHTSCIEQCSFRQGKSKSVKAHHVVGVLVNFAPRSSSNTSLHNQHQQAAEIAIFPLCRWYANGVVPFCLFCCSKCCVALRKDNQVLISPSFNVCYLCVCVCVLACVQALFNFLVNMYGNSFILVSVIDLILFPIFAEQEFCSNVQWLNQIKVGMSDIGFFADIRYAILSNSKFSIPISVDTDVDIWVIFPQTLFR
jgi:hypothetical protein